MKKITAAVFISRVDAETAIGRLHHELSIPYDDIAFVFRDIHTAHQMVDSAYVTASADKNISTDVAVEHTLHSLADSGAIDRSAEQYEDSLSVGNVLLLVQANEFADVNNLLDDAGGIEIRIF